MSRFQPFKNVEFQCLPNTFLWKDIACYKNKDVDVWLYLNPSLPLLIKPRLSILIALDFSIFYEDSSLALTGYIKNTLLKFLQKLSLKNVSHVVCISQATKTDLQLFFPAIDQQKVSVAMCGFNRISEMYAGAVIKDLPEDYFLMVGVIKPRKNQLTAIKAFIKAKKNGLKGKLLITGSGGGTYFESLMQIIKASAYEQDIIFKGYVTNEELVTLYKNARAFVFPSHIEGFGMVIVEAMSCGVPVISSSNSAQGEVANGYALTLDSHDIDGFSDAILKLQDESVREDLIKKGNERASHFSWEKSAAEYAEIIERISQ